MPYTDTWNAAFEALPADGDLVSQGADRIRDTKLAVRERLEKDHYLAIAGTDADHGEHVKVTLRVQTSKPTAEADKGWLYSKDVSAKAELFYEDEDGDEVQLTTGGAVNSGAPVKATGAELDTGTDDDKFATALALVTSHNVPSVAPSTSGNVLTSNGTDWTSTTPVAIAGSVLQVVNYNSGALQTISSSIPADDTIPQITEGTEWGTLAITPASVTNKLVIDVVIQISPDINQSTVVVALFQGTTANALAAAIGDRPWGGGNITVSLKHYMAAGSIAAITFRVRVGAVGTAYINGESAARLFGGVMSSSITITEIKV